MHNLTFDLGVKITQNVVQYPLDLVIYSATQFEVATSNGLGENKFSRKYIICPLTLTLLKIPDVAHVFSKRWRLKLC